MFRQRVGIGLVLLAISVLAALGSRRAEAEDTEAGTRQFAVAVGFQNQKLYEQAVDEWATFIKKFPKDSRLDKAQHYLGT